MKRNEFYQQLSDEILSAMRSNPLPGHVLAKEWSVSPGLVFRLAKRNNIQLPRRAPGLKSNMNERRNRQIRHLKESGLTNREIALRMGLHESTVCGIVTGYTAKRNFRKRMERAQGADA